MLEAVHSHPKKRAFLAAYRETGNVRLACTAAQIGRSSHYRWLDDSDYAEQFEQAKKDAVDVLEAEARRRAVEGWEEPVGWYKGQAGGTVRRYCAFRPSGRTSSEQVEGSVRSKRHGLGAKRRWSGFKRPRPIRRAGRWACFVS